MSRFRRASLGDDFGYTPGEQPPDNEGWLKLNTNESPLAPSPRVADAVATLGLAHVVVTSVARDGATTEILTPSSEGVVRELLSLDPALTNLEVMSAGLEEAFLSLTQTLQTEVA